MLAAVNALRAGDQLVIAKRDRIARDVLLSAVIEKMVSDRRASLVSADGSGNGSDPSSVLMRNILSAIAMYEKSLASIRTKAAMRSMKERRLVYGKVPFGFRRTGKSFTEDEREQDILNIVSQMRAGKAKWREIAAYLNDSGRLNRSGRVWSVQNLSAVYRGSEQAC